MAPVKKTPRAEAPISRSSMRAASCSSPTFARLGRPSGTRRTFGTATAMIVCPLSRRSPWRRVAAASGCISISMCATSPAPRSSCFSASCSVTSEVRSSCCGMAAKFIGVGTSEHFSRAVAGSRSTAFQATRRSSIPMSSSGRRQSASCRTSITMGSSHSRCTSCDPFSASADLRPSFARVFGRRTCRGRNPSGRFLRLPDRFAWSRAASCYAAEPRCIARRALQTLPDKPPKSTHFPKPTQ